MATPKKVNRDNLDEACEEIIEHLRKGFTVMSLCGKWLWSAKRLKTAIDKYPAIKEAIKVGNNAKRYDLEQRYVEYLGGKIDERGSREFEVLNRLLEGVFNSDLADDKSIQEAILIEEVKVIEASKTRAEKAEDNKEEFNTRLELSNDLEKLFNE